MKYQNLLSKQYSIKNIARDGFFSIFPIGSTLIRKTRLFFTYLHIPLADNDWYKIRLVPCNLCPMFHFKLSKWRNCGKWKNSLKNDWSKNSMIKQFLMGKYRLLSFSSALKVIHSESRSIFGTVPMVRSQISNSMHFSSHIWRVKWRIPVRTRECHCFCSVEFSINIE